MSNYNLLDFKTLIRAIGKGVVFYGTGAFAGSGNDLVLTHLGDTEGEIGVELNPEYSALTVPEQTGPIPHAKYLDGIAPVVTIPLFAADLAIRSIVSPTGSAHGGYDRRQAVTEYSLVIFPYALFTEGNTDVEVGYTTAGGWTVGGDAATTAQLALLDLALFFWRGHFDPVVPKYMHADGGKEIQEVTFTSMDNEDMPQGHRVFTAGRPEQATPAIEIAAA